MCFVGVCVWASVFVYVRRVHIIKFVHSQHVIIVFVDFNKSLLSLFFIIKLYNKIALLVLLSLIKQAGILVLPESPLCYFLVNDKNTTFAVIGIQNGCVCRDFSYFFYMRGQCGGYCCQLPSHFPGNNKTTNHSAFSFIIY